MTSREAGILRNAVSEVDYRRVVSWIEKTLVDANGLLAAVDERIEAEREFLFRNPTELLNGVMYPLSFLDGADYYTSDNVPHCIAHNNDIVRGSYLAVGLIQLTPDALTSADGFDCCPTHQSDRNRESIEASVRERYDVNMRQYADEGYTFLKASRFSQKFEWRCEGRQWIPYRVYAIRLHKRKQQ